MNHLSVIRGMEKENAIPVPAYDLPEGFCYAHDMVEDAILDIRYAGTNNFVGDIIDGYEAPYAILTLQAAAALKNAADDFRKMGFRILLFDAYRPQSAVEHFVRWAHDGNDIRMKDQFYPDIPMKTLMLEQGYIAPNSSHCRGSVIDLSLTDMNGIPLDMGTGFDFFGVMAWHGAEGLTDQQIGNRRILCEIMEKNGFTRYEKEWWHYKLIDEPFTCAAFNFPVK